MLALIYYDWVFNYKGSTQYIAKIRLQLSGLPSINKSKQSKCFKCHQHFPVDIVLYNLSNSTNYTANIFLPPPTETCLKTHDERQQDILSLVIIINGILCPRQ